jgi:aryl-alcohol dehydrogenase-like predicted oxidoreductase
MLPTASLGRTGLQVTRLGYGALELMGRVSDRGRELSAGQAGRVLNAVLDAGINFIDTADCYGLSEETLGRHISHRRSEYLLGTKVGCHRDAPPSGGAKDYTAEGMRYNVERSLNRLKTDYLDLLMLHTPVVNTVDRDTIVETLDDLKLQGKVRWVGISTNLPHLPHFFNWDVFDVFHVAYSPLQRQHEEWLRKIADSGAGNVVRSGAGRGEPDMEDSLAYLQGVRLSPSERYRYFELLDLDELREDGESRVAFILRYVWANPGAHTVISGTIDEAHLRENVQALSRGPLPRDVVEEANRRLGTVHMVPAPVLVA